MKPEPPRIVDQETAAKIDNFRQSLKRRYKPTEVDHLADIYLSQLLSDRR